jgi:hypothetical protein
MAINRPGVNSGDEILFVLDCSLAACGAIFGSSERIDERRD